MSEKERPGGMEESGNLAGKQEESENLAEKQEESENLAERSGGTEEPESLTEKLEGQEESGNLAGKPGGMEEPGSPSARAGAGRFSAVVLAAGSGRRMGGDTKKQYLSIGGRPLLYHALMAFEKSGVAEIVLVVPKEDEEFVREEIVEKYGIKKARAIVPGGEERYLSSYNGILAARMPYVLIHDGARACVSERVIADACEATLRHGACEVAVPSLDTVKIADEEGFVEASPERARVYLAQTPQGFSRELILSAYETLFERGDVEGLTDDAMAVERAAPGQKIKLAPGDYANIKVTTPHDLPLAERYLS